MRISSIGESLGSGTYGDVYKCTSENGTEYAIKISKTESSNEKLRREDIMLRYLHRDASAVEANIIQRYGIEKGSGNKLGLVLELLGVSLYEYVATKENGLSLRGTKTVARQLSRACAFIHKSGVIHSDIKLGNVLLSLDRTTVKLADFGAAFFEDPAHCPNSIGGTTVYRSPEVILDINPTSAIDIWSLAALIAEMYTRRTVFYSIDNEQSCCIEEDELIAHHHFRLEKQYPDSLVHQGSLAGKQTFKNALLERVSMVSTLSQLVLGKALLKKESQEDAGQLISLLGRMFEYDPKSRITAVEALEDAFLLDPEVDLLKRK